MEKEKNITPINEDLNVPIYEVEEIKEKIFYIRGKQVMLDSDVAMAYHCETRIINQAVKRNIERFPERFCFQLTHEEVENLKSQFVISSLKENNYGGRRKLPYVFTEQGIAMLSGLLKSKIAIKVSINIIDAFVEIKKFLYNNKYIFMKVNEIQNQLIEHDEKIKKVFSLLGKEENIKQKIFFKGQIWDSYSLIVDIIKTAKEKIVIIDNYVDDSILKMLSKKNKNVEVIILTSDRGKITKLDVQKFNKEYPTLKLVKTNKFHDRFIIIDNRELYHCGASIKDLGNKCFAINKIEDQNIINQIINY